MTGLENLKHLDLNLEARIRDQIRELLEHIKPQSAEDHEINCKLILSHLSSISAAVESCRLRMLVHSLYYQSLPVRYEAIVDAHTRTFDWIFKSDQLPKQDPRSSINLLSWLKQGNQIYWITGKPGK